MSFAKYPTRIRGNTISNLILVDNQEVLYGERNLSLDKNTMGFTLPFNSRDVYLNVNAKERGIDQTYRLFIKTIIHEVTHNILVKHIGERASNELDNLFYNERLCGKIKKNLFNIKESNRHSKKYRRNNPKKMKLDDDFWLS